MPPDASEARSLQTLGLLTRGALHEIANPLLALVGSADLALADAEPGTKLHDRISLTRSAGAEISEIVRALQGFIRLQTEPPSELSVGDAATEAVALVERVLPTRGRELRARGDATAMAAPGELRQALVELLVESLEQTAPNVPIELTVDGSLVTVTGGGELRL
ncbi:MAG: hypothetical protein M3R12_11475 [Actinomycetota bacterium]|nr:hypothetical protein [Actinomycetota bacterium]